MKFNSTQVKGRGRGKLLGFPTINLEIPKDFQLEDGIYAVKVFTRGKEFIGAMHYGPIPVFNEDEKTLEVFLIDASDKDIPSSLNYQIETLKYLRTVLNFPDEKSLSEQISRDVIEIKNFTSLPEKMARSQGNNQ